MYDAVERAKRMGIYTIVVDYYPNSPAKRIADRSYLASTTDIDRVLEIARENEIDGVFTGFSDANLMPHAWWRIRLDFRFMQRKSKSM